LWQKNNAFLHEKHLIVWTGIGDIEHSFGNPPDIDTAIEEGRGENI